MIPRLRARAAWLLALALAGLVLTSCTEEDPVLVGLLLPGDEAQRWERVDQPEFEDQVDRTCRGCRVSAHQAGEDPERQADQLEEVLDAGADVVVVAAVDAAAMADRLADVEVPVVAYDRMIEGADYHVSTEAARIGQLQARAVVEAAGNSGRILMINGPSSDPNAAAIEEAAHAVLERNGVQVLAERDPDNWSANQARDWVASQLEERRPGGLDAIYAANDVQAAGVARALREAGVARGDYPAITGQDAELGAVRRLITGEQAMTVHKSLHEQARQAADIAVAEMTDGEVSGGTDLDGTRSWILQPRAVGLDNLTETVVKDGFHTLEEICRGRVTDRCQELGFR